MGDFADKFLDDGQAPVVSSDSIQARIDAIFDQESERHARIARLTEMVSDIARMTEVDAESIFEYAKHMLKITDRNVSAIRSAVKSARKQVKVDDRDRGGWTLNDDGSVKGTYANLKKYLIDDGVGDAFVFNAFSNEIEICEPLPFDKDMNTPTTVKNEHIVMLMDRLSTTYKFETKKNLISDAIVALSYPKSYHPVREYLSALPVWDGVERLKRLLPVCCGSVDNEYTQFVGQLLLVSAVARVMQPGIKYDHMIILEGPQRIGKSLLVKTLAGKWHQEISLTERDDHTVEKMLGVWFAEVAETPFFNMRDMNSVKSFITTGQDRVRLPYLPRSEPFPRQSVFVGTFNPPESGYFRDSTGNTRFLPVRVSGVIDVERVRQDRNQLFAEAKVLYEGGFKLYIPHDNKELWQLVLDEQGKRLEMDEWQDTISAWVVENAKHYAVNGYFVPSRDIYVKALGGQVKDLSTFITQRVAKIMKALNYEQIRKRINGEQFRGYDISRLADRKVSDDRPWEE